MATLSDLGTKAVIAADKRCDPGMTVPELDAALRSAAVSVIQVEGGTPSLLVRFPDLLSMSADLHGVDTRTASIGDVVDEVAVGALLVLMRPVRIASMTDSFHEGFVAAVDQTLNFVIAAHSFARGTVDEELAGRLERIVERLAEGDADEAEIVDAMEVAEKRLRLLSMLPEESRIANALGGIEEIAAMHQVAAKLNIVRQSDPRDFMKWFGEELGEIRGSSAAPA